MAQSENESGPVLVHTGERMVPEASGTGTFWEHIYRYRFATRYARGKRVLDVACGEGYGSAALMKAGAASVIGVDVSPETCEHARQKYGVDARVGDARNLPLPDDSVDLIVSFETIEHIPEPERFLDECARVLAPGGILVISTPNRDVFGQEEAGEGNPFHCSELDQSEFEGMLRTRFRRWTNYTQCHHGARWYSPAGLSLPSWIWWRSLKIDNLYWRFRWRVCGPLRSDDDPTEEERHSPLDLIFRQESLLAHLFNHRAVHSSRWYGGLDPVFFIAVAHVD